MNEEFLGDAPQLARRTSDLTETELSQERRVKLFFALAGFVDSRKTNIFTEARDVAIEQSGFSGAVGTADDDQTIGLLGRGGQVGH